MTVVEAIFLKVRCVCPGASLLQLTKVASFTKNLFNRLPKGLK